MDNRQEGSHVLKRLELWNAGTHFLQVRPVLAGNVHAKECDVIFGCHLVLQEHRVRIDFTPEHVQGSQQYSMSADSQF